MLRILSLRTSTLRKILINIASVRTRKEDELLRREIWSAIFTLLNNASYKSDYVERNYFFFVVIVFVRSEESNMNWSTFDIFDCVNSRTFSTNIKNKSKDASFTYVDEKIFMKQQSFRVD